MIIFNIMYPKISGNEVSLSMSIKNLAERASEVDLLFHLMKLGSNPFSNSCVSFVAGCLYLTWTNGTTPNSCFIGIYHWYLTKLTCLGVMHHHTSAFNVVFDVFVGGSWRINSQHASIAAAFEQVSLSLSCWWKLPAGSHSMTSLCCMMRSFSKNMVTRSKRGAASECPLQLTKMLENKTSPCERSNEGEATQQQTQHQKIW